MMIRNIRTSYIKSDESNYQDLLKVIALICMLVDHYGHFLMQHEMWLRVVGRCVMPIFAFYTGYNFHHRMRHMIWVCGVITMVVSYLMLDAVYTNILVGLALGQLYLLYAGKAILHNSNLFLAHFMGMLILSIVTDQFMDYGTFIIVFMQIGYMRGNGIKDPGYLLFAGLCFAVYTQVIGGFDATQFLASVAFILIGVALLQYAPHNKSISFNLKPISRNMLYIYTITTLGYIVIASM